MGRTRKILLAALASLFIAGIAQGSPGVVAMQAWVQGTAVIAVTQLSGLASNMMTFLSGGTSAQLAAAVTDEVGTGKLVLNTSPALLGATLDGGAINNVTITGATIDCAGNTCTVRIGSDVSGLGTNVATFLATPTSANLAAAITNETGSGSIVFQTAPALLGVSIDGGTINATTITGTVLNCAANTCTVRLASDITGFATGAATFLGAATSANLAALLTDETGSGAAVFGTAPTIIGASIDGGTINAATITAATIDSTSTVPAAAVTGQVSVAHGGTGISTCTNGVVQSASGTISCAAANLASSTYVTGTLALGNGGTGQTSFSSGVLHSNGSSLSSSAVDVTADITGVTPTANGGTGTASPSSGFTTFIASPTGANAAAFFTNETGTGVPVFDTTPTLTSPVINTPTGKWVSALFGHRCTLTTATPVTTADVTGATTLYITPAVHGQMGLYNGSSWDSITSAEISLAIGTISNATNYDVFVYNNSGTATAEALAWSSNTARATALVLQDGVWSKTGALTRRYVCTFRTTATTTTEDSSLKRFVWNQYNRAPRFMANPIESTNSWTYQSATIRQARATATNQVEWVSGDASTLVRLSLDASMDSVSANVARIGIGINTTTAFTVQSTSNAATFGGRAPPTATATAFWTARYVGFPGLGYVTATWNEVSQATTSVTFYGNAGSAAQWQSGLTGEIWN